MKLSSILLAALAFLMPAGANAADVHVAVAANFTAAAKDIAAAFQRETGDQAILSFGSTGKLYTQIANGAPFEVFLSADQARPKKAMETGLAVANSAFTYAYGTLVLYSTNDMLRLHDGAIFKSPEQFDKVAIANPATAPYGEAAVETLKALGDYDAIKGRLVQGDSISQTYQFVATGNADLGFVALSQVISSGTGIRWKIPQSLYTPIAQDAVLLQTGKNNPVARAFMDFLKGETAHAIIESYGYRIK